ncbi:enoyl-CoA hydratase domain-containing protein 3, mitochondrial [Globicephala melas]|uniref:enoyl-CoA hydratase domain-containing protein 3, mitochondrial n=1 Tax=Globicephala melas TaxID=9731 RepID=UPI003872D9B7
MDPVPGRSLGMEDLRVDGDMVFEEQVTGPSVTVQSLCRVKQGRWGLGGAGSQDGRCLNNGPCPLPQVALEVLFTGEPASAREALLHGLLSRVVPEDKTTRMARKVASRGRPVLSLGKAALHGQLARNLRTACHPTSQTMVDNLGLPDAQEGVKASLQKRKPVWSH